MRSTFSASKLFDRPVLRIGDNTNVGYGTVLSVAREINIGKDTLIAPYCLIMDSDDHPVDENARRAREPVRKEDVLPVRIGNNVWLGTRVVVLKGVSIGDNSIIGANSVVGKNIPPNCIAMGFPARVIKNGLGGMD